MNGSAPAPRIGYVLKMFPRLSETFILNEILELERQGLSLSIFSLKRPNDGVAHERAKSVRAPVIYLPERVWAEPARVARALAGVFRWWPRGFSRTFMHVICGRELTSMGRALRRFCQTCCLVHEMGTVSHLHAHFATDPTRLASWAQMICEISFSVTTHAKDLYQDQRFISPGFQFKLSRARFVVTNSLRSAADLGAAWEGEPPMPIYPIYNGIDLDAFAFRERASDPVEPRILFVGRLVEKKGVEHLIEACSFLR